MPVSKVVLTQGAGFQGGANAGQGNTQNNSKQGDNVQDADFEEVK